MVKYKVTSKSPATRYLEIEAEFNLCKTSDIEIILPSWRPGRYEGADYVKNIRNFRILNKDGEIIQFQKTSKNIWSISASEEFIKIKYEYFAYQMDAGASYIDDEVWLLNPINFLVYIENHMNDKCLLSLDIPSGFDISTTLSYKDNAFIAENYFELADKPILACKKLKKLFYNVNQSAFELAIYGEPPIAIESLIEDFRKFSEAQLGFFNTCPFNKYIFIIVVLPYRFYHGVEHADNTVVVLGIDDGTEPKKLIDDLLGVSSHELFHVWNIKKIRPQELQPYNFKNFVIFPTGFVAEGFTTYYGDLFLVRSGVWSIDRYLEEVNIFLKRHYRNIGRHHTSLATSSENLWIDGYKAGAPYHKVSIYVKGALVAMLIDMKIRIITKNKYSLDDILRKLDYSYAEKGYSINNIKTEIELVSNQDFTEFFDSYIYGIMPLTEKLSSCCTHFGLKLEPEHSNNVLETNFGIVTSLKEDKLIVEFLDQNSPGEDLLSIGDQIDLINNEKPIDFTTEKNGSPEIINLQIRRLGKRRHIQLQKSKESFMNSYKLIIDHNADDDQKTMLHSWLK